MGIVEIVGTGVYYVLIFIGGMLIGCGLYFILKELAESAAERHGPGRPHARR